MTYKIGMIGAPSSGKSTAAAILYSELLQRGINSSRLVPEQSAEHLGEGKKIETVEDQMLVVNLQMIQELMTERRNFNPMICDSAIFISEIYMNMMLEKFPNQPRDVMVGKMATVDQYMHVMEVHKSKYDVIIYCPLIASCDMVNKFRIHTNEQAKEIDDKIKFMLDKLPENVKVFRLGQTYKDRDNELKAIADLVVTFYKGD